MNERSALIGYLRGEIVGPAASIGPATTVHIVDGAFQETGDRTRGALVWMHPDSDEPQEILYHDRETPHRKYGAGLLSPEQASVASPGDVAAQAADTIGVDVFSEEDASVGDDSDDTNDDLESSAANDSSDSDDYEVTSADVRHPSTMGISFCASLPAGSALLVRMPRSRRFAWQPLDDTPFLVNGRYEDVAKVSTSDGAARRYPASRRYPAVSREAEVEFSLDDVRRPTPTRKRIATTLDSMVLSVELYARKLKSGDDDWLLTVVLRNRSSSQQAASALRASTLYQSYFEVSVRGGALRKYPESQRPFEQLDGEEQSMMLLYQESATWAIGHGCAAAWDAEPEREPTFVYADVMPAVELPSMTPDINDEAGRSIRLGMRDFWQLDDNKGGPGWRALESLVNAYGLWIGRKRAEVADLKEHFRKVAERHLDGCDECLARIRRGLALLESNAEVRRAFRLANVAMLLQQIATKKIPKTAMRWDGAQRRVARVGAFESPWSVYASGSEGDRIGHWRPFQAAFLLMQLEGVSTEASPDRSLIDLIWFPTGGGKTEAYLGVMAFHMFYQRLIAKPNETPARDGTNAIMRYTLRMLTTQQFQRAASLICAMEYLRRHGGRSDIPPIGGRPFSLALWIGGAGSPNRISEAQQAVKRYREGKENGNPLVLTDCPWCRASIGLVDVPKAKKVLVGVMEVSKTEGPQLLCPDPACEFGGADPRTWLPVEVIDERIYRARPSLVIATADKFAMLAYRDDARCLFGLDLGNGQVVRAFLPPALIIQDELHLIAGPLGTMYALYEGVIERLCSQGDGDERVRPKVIASTATIRGAADQTKALYARVDRNGDSLVRLFPAPGLRMGDSFYGVYARTSDGKLQPGRLYLGIHANEYGSVLTAQVRAFAAAICRAGQMEPDRRDPWWTLLNFYNSLRELGGAKTLFDSDIRSRLKFLQNRENLPAQARRRLHITEELTSRLSQAEIVGMMDRLAISYGAAGEKALDACLASNIIEVGVDIDRLSLMGVVGQPKTTAQYIQVTGRVGRKWEERPGLILTVYSPGKSRDRSHYEQFHSYHRRLYERVEPTSATPFAISAIQRGLSGALIAYARTLVRAPVGDFHAYRDHLAAAFDLLTDRCGLVQRGDDLKRSLEEMGRVRDSLVSKWNQHPQKFEEFPPKPDGEYLMLWPGQYSSKLQQHRGVVVPSSMRQVDASGELLITPAYTVNPQD